jgi:hypothetical protein
VGWNGADDEIRTRDIDVVQSVALARQWAGMERMTRFELATSTLGRSRSTN